MAFFVAEYTPDDRFDNGGGLESEGEDIEVLELDLDDALDRIANGQIVDGKTVLLLQWAQINDRVRRHTPSGSKGS